VVWQELLIGIAAIYNSGGSLRDYLQGKYESLAAKKTLESGSITRQCRACRRSTCP
jgi:hypothetical protein